MLKTNKQAVKTHNRTNQHWASLLLCYRRTKKNYHGSKGGRKEGNKERWGREREKKRGRERRREGGRKGWISKQKPLVKKHHLLTLKIFV